MSSPSAPGSGSADKALATILEMVSDMAESVQTLNQKFDALATAQAETRAELVAAIQGFKAEIQRLNGVIASGGGVSQADLDALGGRLDQAIVATRALVDQADA